MNIKDIEARIAALHAELQTAQEAERVEREALRQATKRVWKFIFTPATQQQRGWIRNRDESLELWSLRGEVLNQNECVAVGYSGDFLRGGGMNYWYNRCSGKVAFAEGGGNIYIPYDPPTNDSKKRTEMLNDSELTFKKLDRFILDNPQGGEVTDIILAQRHFGWR